MSPDDLFPRPYPDENYVPPDQADLRKQALQKAYEIAKDITTEQNKVAEPKPPVDRGPLLRAANSALAVAIAIWLLFAPPDWLPRNASDRRTPEQRELGLRVVLATEAARIEAYREAQQALPTTLAEANGDGRMVQYTKLDETRYRLVASDDGASLTYESTTPLADLLNGTRTSR